MASGQARVALRSLSATPLGYGVLPVRTSMYIPKRKGEANCRYSMGRQERDVVTPPPPTPFCVFGFLLSCVDYRASSVGCSELQYL